MFAEKDLSIDADLRLLHEAREWAAGAAREFGFDADGCYQVKLAMSEAVANAIQHGSQGPQDTVHITARERRGALVFEVRDTGRYVAPAAPAGEMAERGRGLALVGLVMDEVQLEPGEDGSLLRFSKRLDTAASRAS
ncbi:MAG TPA: ATP-binding protein [Thermoleophilaceae bacterium]|nr:ATP-binding protein [Thermoleophilaceae bacterium]